MPIAALGWVVRLLMGATRFGSTLLGMFKATRIGKWLWFGLFLYMGGVIGRIFTLVGVTLVANTFVTPSLTHYVAGQLVGLPSDWVQFIGLTKVDQAITIVLSALVIRMIDTVQVKKRQASWQTPL